MNGFFESCVEKIMDLLEGHIGQIDRLNRKTKVSIAGLSSMLALLLIL
jgi:hypothetical protein